MEGRDCLGREEDPVNKNFERMQEFISLKAQYKNATEKYTIKSSRDIGQLASFCENKPVFGK